MKKTNTPTTEYPTLRRITSCYVCLQIFMKLRLFLLFLSPIVVPANAETLGDYLSKNNEIVIEYLESLSTNHIGMDIAGVTLTDSSNPLNRYRYLGKNVSMQDGLNIYMFQSSEGKTEAYLWVTHGNPFTLPYCEEYLVGAGSYVLSGDVYTLKQIQPGHGIVKNLCPSSEWIEQ